MSEVEQNTKGRDTHCTTITALDGQTKASRTKKTLKYKLGRVGGGGSGETKEHSRFSKAQLKGGYVLRIRTKERDAFR